MESDEIRRVSRRLRDLVEPIAANVYFAPEAQDSYRRLGLSYLPGYFCSRSACMGQLPGEAVAATFGVATRGWTPEQVDAALARLRDRGLVQGEAFTAEGEALRASIEEATDRGETRIAEALGADADELFDLLEPWATAVVESGGYPANPADLTRR